MSRAARSLLVFGIYLLLLGVILVIAPKPVLALFHMQAAGAVWVRVVGMLVCFLGCYYAMAARCELKPFFQWSVPIRALTILFFGTFAILNWVTPEVVVIGVVDIAGALWTWMALRADRRAEM